MTAFSVMTAFAIDANNNNDILFLLRARTMSFFSSDSQLGRMKYGLMRRRPTKSKATAHDSSKALVLDGDTNNNKKNPGDALYADNSHVNFPEEKQQQRQQQQQQQQEQQTLENFDEDEHELNFSLFDPILLKARIITHLPKKYGATVGSKVAFTCLTTVLFPVEVDWFLNGQPLHATPDGRIYFSKNNRQLVILYMTSQEEGVLEVVARNKFGREKSQCKLCITPATSASTCGNTNRFDCS